MTVVAGGASAARPQLIRAINEQVLLDHIRRSGPLSRTELARLSGLSKPTVSAALGTIERAGLVHATGQRTGVPGPAAQPVRAYGRKQGSSSGWTSGASSCAGRSPIWPAPFAAG